MKRVIQIVLLTLVIWLTVILFTSCCTEVSEGAVKLDEIETEFNIKHPYYFEIKLGVIELDSCEYIIIKDNNGGSLGRSMFTHKGNCKYCLERNSKSVDTNSEFWWRD